MNKVQVVEIRRLTEEEVVVPIARFVLMPEGRAHVVELRPNGQSMVEMLLQEGVPGQDGTLLFPKDGLAFMQRLPYLLHATYLWATEVFEMDAAEALAGIRRTLNATAGGADDHPSPVPRRRSARSTVKSVRRGNP